VPVSAEGASSQVMSRLDAIRQYLMVGLLSHGVAPTLRACGGNVNRWNLGKSRTEIRGTVGGRSLRCVVTSPISAWLPAPSPAGVKRQATWRVPEQDDGLGLTKHGSWHRLCQRRETELDLELDREGVLCRRHRMSEARGPRVRPSG
jgi:hypothetical protein